MGNVCTDRERLQLRQEFPETALSRQVPVRRSQCVQFICDPISDAGQLF